MERREFLRRAALTTAAALGGIPLAASSSPEVVLWDSHAPVLDQGQIGSCTGNAVTQFLNTDYAMKISGRTTYLTEADAVKIYTLATEIDTFPGDYPEADTGSTGSSSCEAAVRLGYLSGYDCVYATVEAITAALRTQPLVVGTDWYLGMSSPDSTGLVNVSGPLAGGHEYAILGFDMGSEQFTCLNSWSDSWGQAGRFKVRFQDFVSLLGGDSSAINRPTVKPA